jgi:hypothetical protein
MSHTYKRVPAAVIGLTQRSGITGVWQWDVADNFLVVSGIGGGHTDRVHEARAFRVRQRSTSANGLSVDAAADVE